MDESDPPHEHAPAPEALQDVETWEPLKASAEPARPRRGFSERERWTFVALLSLSALVHLLRLGAPGALLANDADQCVKLPPLQGARCYELIPLDEVHYVPDARDILTYGTASDDRVPDGDGQSGKYVVHPPVGKWFIAAGIRIFGDRPFGWRFFGAVFGALSTAIMYLLARRLWRAEWAPALAALLLTVEGLWFVQSRVAMLDIYGGTFVLAGVWMLLEDRDAPGRFRWWRIGAALMFGLALSTKWAVAPFVAVAVGMSFAWEMARASAAERPRRLARTAAVVAIFGFLPLATYVAAEIPWFLDAHRYAPGDCADPDPGDGSRTTLAFRLRDSLAGEFVCYQTQVFRFHRDLEKFEAAGDDDASSSTTGGTTKLKPSHPYFGQAYAWPWIGRPVAHYYEGLGEGKSARASEVLGLPNPAIWWAGFLAVPFLAWLTVVRRDAVASLVIGMVIAGWGPYLFADAVNRPVFLFYATPLVPYLVIGIVHVLVRISSWWRGASWLPAGYAAVAVLTFAYFYPVLAAHPIPREGILGWESHMWYSGPLSDCGVANAIKIFCWI